MVQVRRLHSLKGHSDAIYALATNETGNVVFSGSADGMVVMWDLDSPSDGKLIAKLPHSVFALHVLPLDNLLVAGHNFEGIHLLDYSSGKEVASLPLGHAHVFDLKSFEDDLWVALGDGTVTVVDMAHWRIKTKINHSEKSARSLAINAAENEIAVAYSDNFVRVFDASNYSLKQAWRAHDNSVFALRYDPRGRFLLSGSRDAHLKVWEAAGRYQLVQDIVAHMYTINHIDFSPDGKHFVTCSRDKTIKVWDGEVFKLLKVIDKDRYAGHANSVNKVAWTSFNDQLIGVSDDRTLSVWEIFF